MSVISTRNFTTCVDDRSRSLPPKASPIWEECVVNSLDKAIATCHGLAMEFITSFRQNIRNSDFIVFCDEVFECFVKLLFCLAKQVNLCGLLGKI